MRSLIPPPAKIRPYVTIWVPSKVDGWDIVPVLVDPPLELGEMEVDVSDLSMSIAEQAALDDLMRDA